MTIVISANASGFSEQNCTPTGYNYNSPIKRTEADENERGVDRLLAGQDLMKRTSSSYDGRRDSIFSKNVVRSRNVFPFHLRSSRNQDLADLLEKIREAHEFGRKEDERQLDLD